MSAHRKSHSRRAGHLQNFSKKSLSFSTENEHLKDHDHILDPLTAIKIVPIFTGFGDSVDRFVKTSRIAYAAVCENLKPFMLEMIRAQCTGEANEFLLGQADTLSDLESLLNVIKDAYKLHDDYCLLIAEISTIKQKNNETVHEYGKRVNKLLTRIIFATKDNFTTVDNNNIDIIEATRKNVIHCFIRGLIDTEVRQNTKIENPLCLNKAISIARRAETECLFRKKLINSKNNTEVNTKRTFNKSELHFIKNLKVLKGKVEFKGKCHKCKELGHTRSKCDKFNQK